LKLGSAILDTEAGQRHFGLGKGQENVSDMSDVNYCNPMDNEIL